ncbi:MAG: WbuC family cupin fold metalloprotein [Nitrospinota bacterium]|nr:WbuC family cupin fold metalloprotein [Nitrospinota bacterium]
MRSLERIGDGVFVAKDEIVSIGDEETAFLKAEAERSKLRRARICAHKSTEDPLHEMLIAISSKSYIIPHKHINKSESFHIIEGEADVVVFDDDGTIVELIELGARGDGKNYFYRLPEGMFHTLLVRTQTLVLHEVTNGPFIKERTVMGDFAPPESKEAEVEIYMKKLLQEVAIFKRNSFDG